MEQLTGSHTGGKSRPGERGRFHSRGLLKEGFPDGFPPGIVFFLPLKSFDKVWLFFEKKGKGRGCTEFSIHFPPHGHYRDGRARREERRLPAIYLHLDSRTAYALFLPGRLMDVIHKKL